MTSVISSYQKFLSSFQRLSLRSRLTKEPVETLLKLQVHTVGACTLPKHTYNGVSRITEQVVAIRSIET